MTKEIVKRSFYFPRELLDHWQQFHFPSKDYSPSAAAAFVLYMACDAENRELIRKLAHKNTEEAIQRAKTLFKKPNQSA